jgi:hypothetical protein
MNYTVIVSSEAKYNADEIFSWINTRSPQGAIAWFEAFLSAIGKLKVDPSRSALAPESHGFNYEVRQVLFHSPRGRRYRVLYRIMTDVVEVLYVRGPGQRPVQ